MNDPYLYGRDRYPSHWHWQAWRQTTAPEQNVAAPPRSDSRPVLRTFAVLAVILVLLFLA